MHAQQNLKLLSVNGVGLRKFHNVVVCVLVSTVVCIECGKKGGAYAALRSSNTPVCQRVELTFTYCCLPMRNVRYHLTVWVHLHLFHLNQKGLREYIMKC